MSSLPTLDRLNTSIPPNLDAQKVASHWFDQFASYVESADVDNILTLLLEDAFWRDILSITWDFRTIDGSSKIRQFLQDRICKVKLHALKLETAEFAQFFPDLAWIQGLFSFEIGDNGIGAGVFRIVPTSTGEWKGHCIYTNLESLKHFPAKIGLHRDQSHSNSTEWLQKRQKEQTFEGTEPYVLIVGGGQCGLETAAHLKCLDVPTLVVEKSARIGDSWRSRYTALCLNDPVWCDHMAYMPFPASWPTHASGEKLAAWIEFYANSLELNVWLSSTVTSVSKDDKTDQWNVAVWREDKQEERTFHPTHVVFALGLISPPYVPEIPGREEFDGEVLHSSRYTTAGKYAGKKVVVVGTGASGHDISADCVRHGVDVTMYQRSPVYVVSAERGFPVLLGPYQEDGPPVDLADRMSTSFPTAVMKLIARRSTKYVAELDKELLEGLEKRGFRTSLGLEDCGLFLHSVDRTGGFYINHGASELILDGSIKIKSDAEIREFTKKGIKFDNGSELEADVVVFATGYSALRDSVRKICGEEITEKLKKLGGLDEEGEISSFWRYSGVDRLWMTGGSLAVARHNSRHLALQIKAIKENVYGERYSY